MVVSFRCLRSGNIVKFSADHDIVAMRKEVGYQEIKDESETPDTESRQFLQDNGKESYAESQYARSQDGHADRSGEQKAKDVLMPLRNNGKVDKRSLAYRQSTGRS